MAEVKFEDFSVKVKDALDEAAYRFLETAANEVQSQAQRNTPTDTGQLKGAWSHIVDEAKKEATIGNPLENALWTEFGTGEYADTSANGGKPGRKGGWYIPAEKLTDKAKSKMQSVEIDGKEFYHTYGKRPVRMLHNAFESKKASLKKLAEQIFKERLK